MCLLAVASGASDEFPVVIAHNRDEYYARQASPLAIHEDGTLCATDVSSGGTWMGYNCATGHIAALTNVRAAAEPGKRSRGELVSRALAGDAAAALMSGAFGSYNLLHGQLRRSSGTTNCAVELFLSSHVPAHAVESAPLPPTPVVAAKSNDHGGAKWTLSSSDPLHECTWPKACFVCSKLESALAGINSTTEHGEEGAKAILASVETIMSARSLPEPYAQRAATWQPAGVNHLPVEAERKLQAAPFIVPFQLPTSNNGVLGPGAKDFTYGTVSQSVILQCRSKECVFYAYRSAPEWEWNWQCVDLPSPSVSCSSDA